MVFIEATMSLSLLVLTALVVTVVHAHGGDDAEPLPPRERASLATFAEAAVAKSLLTQDKSLCEFSFNDHYVDVGLIEEQPRTLRALRRARVRGVFFAGDTSLAAPQTVVMAALETVVGVGNARALFCAQAADTAVVTAFDAPHAESATDGEWHVLYEQAQSTVFVEVYGDESLSDGGDFFFASLFLDGEHVAGVASRPVPAAATASLLAITAPHGAKFDELVLRSHRSLCLVSLATLGGCDGDDDDDDDDDGHSHHAQNYHGHHHGAHDAQHQKRSPHHDDDDDDNDDDDDDDDDGHHHHHHSLHGDVEVGVVADGTLHATHLGFGKLCVVNANEFDAGSVPSQLPHRLPYNGVKYLAFVGEVDGDVEPLAGTALGDGVLADDEHMYCAVADDAGAIVRRRNTAVVRVGAGGSYVVSYDDAIKLGVVQIITDGTTATVDVTVTYKDEHTATFLAVPLTAASVTHVLHVHSTHMPFDTVAVSSTGSALCLSAAGHLCDQVVYHHDDDDDDDGDDDDDDGDDDDDDDDDKHSHHAGGWPWHQ